MTVKHNLGLLLSESEMHVVRKALALGAVSSEMSQDEVEVTERVLRHLSGCVAQAEKERRDYVRHMAKTGSTSAPTMTAPK